LLLMALGITACIVAWGYLVVAAVDFGSTARSGDTTAWWFLALASVGAVACLFVGLMLVARVLRRLGITQGSREPAAGGHEGAHADHHAHRAEHHAAHHEGTHAAHHADADHPEAVRPIGGRRAAR
jgi:ABC-type nickel/cobalt efflux system permease component RcnA